MTPTTDEIREMALDIEQWSDRLLHEGSGMGPSHEYIAEIAAALRLWIAERENRVELSSMLADVPDSRIEFHKRETGQ